MDISFNIPDWLKIPLKILLPALWIFSGTMILLPDEWLQKLYLLEWAQKNGFAFGLIFVVVSCLLLVYLIFYVVKKVSSLYYKLTFKRRTFKNITGMSDIQQAIIYKLYNSPGFTAQLDFNQPVVQGLLGLNYIFMGGQQQVTMYRLSNSIFTAEKHGQSLEAAFPATKAIQDYVYTDGTAEKSIERRFVEELDGSAMVNIYAKLPKGFSIPTPVGHYSPDWAIVFHEGDVRHIYFIAETKGTMDSLNLRPIEKAKIDCAKKLFTTLSNGAVTYDHVDSYQQLMNKVMH